LIQYYYRRKPKLIFFFNVALDQQCEQFNLCENEVKVYSAVAGSDLLGAAATDLPYVFSIEVRPQTTCWPGRTLFLLASSFPEKQRWVRALENTVNERKPAALPNNNQVADCVACYYYV
jgi:hypothetical protein